LVPFRVRSRQSGSGSSALAAFPSLATRYRCRCRLSRKEKEKEDEREREREREGSGRRNEGKKRKGEAMRKRAEERNRLRGREGGGALFSARVRTTTCPCVRGDTTTGSWRPPPDLAPVGRSVSTLPSSSVQTLDYISADLRSRSSPRPARDRFESLERARAAARWRI